MEIVRVVKSNASDELTYKLRFIEVSIDEKLSMDLLKLLESGGGVYKR